MLIHPVVRSRKIKVIREAARSELTCLQPKIEVGEAE